jgi:hypothetical protein
MSEEIKGQNSIASLEDLVSKKERVRRHYKVDATSIIRLCQKQKIQPREKLLRDFEASERSDDLAIKIKKVVAEMPDYNLDDKAEFILARDFIFNLYLMKIDSETETQQNISGEGIQKNWIKAGLLSYEFGEEGEIFLHIPPMDGKPGLHEFMNSLNKIAEFLKGRPDIHSIRGNSLLLAHNLADRLGFKIDSQYSRGESPGFQMSREEFLQRFGI